MRLSSNFKELLVEMEKQAFTMPAHDEDGDWFLALKHPNWKHMFLFEESDFDKAIAIYSDKDYSSWWDLKQLEETKQYLKARDFVYGDDFWTTSNSDNNLFFYQPDTFVRGLRSDMFYRKKDAGRAKAQEILDEYWYKQPDYQVVDQAMWNVNRLIDYWTSQRRCIEQKQEHQARYKSLAGVSPAF